MTETIAAGSAAGQDDLPEQTDTGQAETDEPSLSKPRPWPI